ncbi:hypothetical protein F4X90_03115 [Candidatus Poribacteria bacterium]|nr:hypothetical protein [Candidatus Poribacteria bacterium]
MFKKNENSQIITQVIDTGDLNESSWAKPTEPSPAPVDIAPLPPQQGEGNNPPSQQGEGNNPPPQQGESGSTDSEGT